MSNLNPFLDKRPIPKISINVKVKIKSDSAKENADWNKAFGYIMKKPRTKLEFLTVNLIRKLPLENITLETDNIKNISDNLGDMVSKYNA